MGVLSIGIDVETEDASIRGVCSLEINYSRIKQACSLLCLSIGSLGNYRSKSLELYLFTGSRLIEYRVE